jgi:predicted transcriptional regulator of viral defense system
MSEFDHSPDGPVTIRRTKLASAVLTHLLEDRQPVTTPYDLFQYLRKIFLTVDRKALFLRDTEATTAGLKRVLNNLTDTQALASDPDYRRGVHRVLPAGEATAEDVCALVNPFGYVSHLSAMQHWGLTDRRPEALHLTMPPPNAARPFIEAKMAADYGAPFVDLPPNQAIKLTFIQHPPTVRGRPLSIYETRHLGQWLPVRDSPMRLATIGQTFVDTLERSDYCGGMVHVIDVWREHANTYVEEIISAIDGQPSPIVKVRAGYLLDEMLGQSDPRIENWTRFAQRGGSRLLDHTKSFSPNHSAKWMLSINV